MNLEENSAFTQANTLPTPPLTIHYHDRRPYYLSVGNEVHGLIADPINTIFKLTDIPYKWVKTPAKRQLELIRKNTSAACAAGWFKNPEREQFGKFTLPIYRDRPFVAIAMRDNSLLGESETLERVFQESRLRLLVKGGYSYGSYIDAGIQSYSPWIIETTGNNSAMLQMIIDHRADYCFMTGEEANEVLMYAGFNHRDFKIVHFSDMPEGNFRYLICSKMVKEEDINSLNSAIMNKLSVYDMGE